MDVSRVCKAAAAETAKAVIPAALVTGTAAIMAPVLGVPVLAGVAFVGAFVFTANAVSTVGDLCLKAAKLHVNHPTAYTLAKFGISAIGAAAGTAAAFGVTTVLPITFSAGCLTLGVSALTLLAATIALSAVVGIVALAALAIGGLIAYKVLEKNEEKQKAVCQFLHDKVNPKTADGVWQMYHPGEKFAG